MSSVVLISCSSSARRAAGWCRPCTPRGCRPLSRASLRRARTASAARPCRLLVTSVVAPPLVGRRDGAALVLHGDAAQGVVLALGVAGPVVRHEDARERGVAVEDDPEHVEGLAL